MRRDSPFIDNILPFAARLLMNSKGMIRMRWPSTGPLAGRLSVQKGTSSGSLALSCVTEPLYSRLFYTKQRLLRNEQRLNAPRFMAGRQPVP